MFPAALSGGSSEGWLWRELVGGGEYIVYVASKGILIESILSLLFSILK